VCETRSLTLMEEHRLRVLAKYLGLTKEK